MALLFAFVYRVVVVVLRLCFVAYSPLFGASFRCFVYRVVVVVLRLWFVACDLGWPLRVAEDKALAQNAAQHIQVDGNLQIVRSAASNSEVLHQLQRPRRCVVLLL